MKVVFCEAVSWLLIMVPGDLPGDVVVSVFFLYKVLLLLGEYLERLVHVLQPRVLVNLFYCDALLGVDFKKASEQVDGVTRDFFFENELSRKDDCVKIFH